MGNGFSSTAMVLAAGLGTRMRPLTLAKPKPLQIVGGRTMLDHALDKLVAIGIERVVVNSFYLADQIEEHLRARRDVEIIISREEELLDTGGGILKALPHFGGQPFFALNADLPWIDGDVPGLGLLRQVDFAMKGDGRLYRKDVAPPRPFVVISAQILKPELFAAPPARIFSNNWIWNEAEERGRLYGAEYSGTCYHVGTPEDLQRANALLASGQGWGV